MVSRPKTYFWKVPRPPKNQCFKCPDYSSLGDMVHDAFKLYYKDTSPFKDMLKDAERPLYLGLKHSKLSGLMKLYNIKRIYGWSDSGILALLKVLNEILLNDNRMPKSMYEAKRTLKHLGLDYDKIYVCPNDYILYGNKLKNPSECTSCGASRWQKRKDRSKKN